MSTQNSIIDVLHSGSGREYGNLRVGEFITSGSCQDVYELLGKQEGLLLKRLQHDAHTRLFVKDFSEINNIDFYHTILHVRETMGIILPDNWDIIDIAEEKDKEEIAFLQSDMGDIIMQGGFLPRIPSDLSSTPRIVDRGLLLHEFARNEKGKNTLVDWDHALGDSKNRLSKIIRTSEDLERLKDYGKSFEGIMLQDGHF